MTQKSNVDQQAFRWAENTVKLPESIHTRETTTKEEIA